MRLNWYQVCVRAPPTCVCKLHQNRAIGIVAIRDGWSCRVSPNMPPAGRATRRGWLYQKKEWKRNFLKKNNNTEAKHNKHCDESSLPAERKVKFWNTQRTDWPRCPALTVNKKLHMLGWKSIASQLLKAICNDGPKWNQERGVCYYSCRLAEGKWWRQRHRSTSSPAARSVADIDTPQRWCQTTVRSVQSQNENPNKRVALMRVTQSDRMAADIEEEVSDSEGDRVASCRV